MSAAATLKKLIALGLPDQWLVPVLNAITGPATPTRKRRKRRTKEQMAADAAKTKRKAKASA